MKLEEYCEIRIGHLYFSFDDFTCFATALARSLQVSVFPVPAGPSGEPPKYNCIAPIKVLKMQNQAHIKNQ